MLECEDEINESLWAKACVRVNVCKWKPTGTVRGWASWSGYMKERESVCVWKCVCESEFKKKESVLQNNLMNLKWFETRASVMGMSSTFGEKNKHLQSFKPLISFTRNLTQTSTIGTFMFNVSEFLLMKYDRMPTCLNEVERKLTNHYAWNRTKTHSVQRVCETVFALTRDTWGA